MKLNQNIEPETRETLLFRAPTMEDLPAAVELFNLCSLDMTGEGQYELGDVSTEWGTPGYNMATDARVLVTRQGQMLAYVEVWDFPPHAQIYVWGRVHPEHRGRGYGTRMLRWGESRARKAIPKAPQGARVAVTGHVLSTNDSANQLLVDRGFRLVRRYFRMEIEMEEPPRPPAWPAWLGPAASRFGSCVRVRSKT
jgi:ribosomal protein S18 acetylase RimI-like enzyme